MGDDFADFSDLALIRSVILGRILLIWRFGGVKPELKNSKKIKRIESGGTTSNDTESIQIAPRDYQKTDLW